MLKVVDILQTIAMLLIAMLLILDGMSFILLAEIFLQKNTQCAYANQLNKVGFICCMNSLTQAGK